MSAAGTPDAGPRVVALGGGHGLAATLQAVRLYAADITAVVSVADDGGSSGRLREAFHIPPPGDLRRCLVALGDTDLVWTRAYEHRFDAGELEGHALGNLVIAGLAATTGDFIAALEEAGRLVGATGRVLPATTVPVVLKAEVGGGHVEGQVAVASAGHINRVSIVPPDAEPPAAAVEAIAAADQVVLGPGSLYTSVLAAAAVPGIAAALATTAARRTYVCNLRAQDPETAGYDVAAHVVALRAHDVDVDVVLFDPAQMPVGDLPAGIDACSRALTKPDGAGHDPARLAEALSVLVG
ncbi:MAG TPA: uridine diphosphate-N-acetylglucosamine-binding protein YvcK [Acidimicrobiales bacterium]|nr:uridine diphosphate-N-acetylglucosamine-binding protein YvcK [Acidimicrobiales bacterium]